MVGEPIEFGSVSYVSRKLLYVFGFYLIWTFAIRQSHFPDGADEIQTFIFYTFLNIGPVWLCYLMIRMNARLGFQRTYLATQFILIGWIMYAYRFAYVVGMPYDAEQYFVVPMQQYLITVPMFVVSVLIGVRERQG
ncbi:MAG: hypothetical protein EAY65_00035 [Alphaproteobacteria bacterium]|nr:MAG: hypothetical protein EAY65_00035 [Alphaproteobacteria bacterium]